jgi:AbrB family looped-hinge helix DNA binding protein
LGVNGRVSQRATVNAVARFFIFEFDPQPARQARKELAGSTFKFYGKDVMRSLLGVEMNTIGKITSKGQTTIPQEIRAVLNVKPGDLLAWEVLSSGEVRVQRVEPLDLEYLRAVEGTLSEWAGVEDEAAYANL